MTSCSFLLIGVTFLSSILNTSAAFAVPSSSKLKPWPANTTPTSHDKHHSSKSQLYLANPNQPAYCEKCGTKTIIRQPPNDERERACCPDPSCGFVSYQNPKIVVGAICTTRDNQKVLLCKRAIEPCAGKWGYPQGFLELNETTRQGAARETLEEAGASFDPAKAKLMAVYNLAGYQVQTIYFVELEDEVVDAGMESSEVGFYKWKDVPWEDLAFPTVEWALLHAKDHVIPLISNDDADDSNIIVQERTKYVDEDGQWQVKEG
mmetsp:Transcript_34731/g.46061  ORF Transcript_34731/g.46061 Transcript_34731/m.46061 type:complete len:263 (-) Transcript_34731:496-1284(-)